MGNTNNSLQQQQLGVTSPRTITPRASSNNLGVHSPTSSSNNNSSSNPTSPSSGNTLGVPIQRANSVKEVTPPEVIQKFQPKRTNVAKEILQTEASYVVLLEALTAKWEKPLRDAVAHKSPILSEEDINAIFIPDLNGLICLHQVMLKQLEKVLSKWDENSSIGGIFLRNASAMKFYTNYVKNFHHARAIWEKNSKTNEVFKKFSKQPERKSYEMSLDNLLIQPIQRIPRYQLLLRDIRKNTWESHEDYEQVSLALEKIEETCKFIDEMQGRAMSIQKMYETGNLLEIKLCDSKDRFILREDTLQMKSRIIGTKVATCWLLNDKLLLFNEKTVYIYDDIEKLKVTPEADNVSLTVSSGTLKTRTIVFPRQSDCEKWKAEFQEAQQKLVSSKIMEHQNMMNLVEKPEEVILVQKSLHYTKKETKRVLNLRPDESLPLSQVPTTHLTIQVDVNDIPEGFPDNPENNNNNSNNNSKHTNNHHNSKINPNHIIETWQNGLLWYRTREKAGATVQELVKIIDRINREMYYEDEEEYSRETTHLTPPISKKLRAQREAEKAKTTATTTAMTTANTNNNSNNSNNSNNTPTINVETANETTATTTATTATTTNNNNNSNNNNNTTTGVSLKTSNPPITTATTTATTTARTDNNNNNSNNNTKLGNKGRKKSLSRKKASFRRSQESPVVDLELLNSNNNNSNNNINTGVISKNSNSSKKKATETETATLKTINSEELSAYYNDNINNNHNNSNNNSNSNNNNNQQQRQQQQQRQYQQQWSEDDDNHQLKKSYSEYDWMMG